MALLLFIITYLIEGATAPYEKSNSTPFGWTISNLELKKLFLTKKKKRWSASGLTRSQACRANKGEREEVLLVLKGDQRALEQALQRHVRLAGARRHAQLRQQRSMPL